MVFIPQVLPPNPVCISALLILATYLSYIILLDLITRIILGERFASYSSA